jgi:hypothetical protein
MFFYSFCLSLYVCLISNLMNVLFSQLAQKQVLDLKSLTWSKIDAKLQVDSSDSAKIAQIAPCAGHSLVNLFRNGLNICKIIFTMVINCVICYCVLFCRYHGVTNFSLSPGIQKIHLKALQVC